MKTLLYRIEMPNGKGICQTTGSHVCDAYRNVVGQTREMYRHSDQTRFETEHSTWPLDKDEKRACYLTCKLHWQYAFPSLERLSVWFPDKEGRKAMKDMGAKIIQYETNDETMNNGYQCLFSKVAATPTGKEFDLETLSLNP